MKDPRSGSGLLKSWTKCNARSHLAQRLQQNRILHVLSLSLSFSPSPSLVSFLFINEMLTPITSLLLLSSLSLGRPYPAAVHQRIPLAKKDGSLTRRDGSLNWEKTQSHVARIQSKFARATFQNQLKVRDAEIDQILADATMMGKAMAVLVIDNYSATATLSGSSTTVTPTLLATPVSRPSTTSSSNPVAAATLADFQVEPSPTPLSLSSSTSPTTTSPHIYPSQSHLAPDIVSAILPNLSIDENAVLFTPVLTTTYRLGALIPTTLPAVSVDENAAIFTPVLSTTYQLGLLIPTTPATPTVATPTPTLAPFTWDITDPLFLGPSTTSTPSPDDFRSFTFVSPSPVPSKMPTSGKQTLNRNGTGSVWSGYITIGTPPVQFLMDMDTGSSDLWVPDVSCRSDACATRATYNASSSSTSSLVKDVELQILYGDGSSTSGPVYMDTVTVAGLTVVNQTFGAITSLSPDWSEDPMDGLLGMAYQSISQVNSQFNSTPFFQTLMLENPAVVPQFSFHFTASSNDSELFLGGMNPSLFVASSTIWYPVTTESYWIIPGQAQLYGHVIPGLNGGKGGDLSCIIDTGTSVIVAPTADAKAYWATIPNSAPLVDGYYTYECDTPPSLSFSFGSHTQTTQWKISSDSLNLGQLGPGSSRCVGAVIGADIGMNVWVLGDAFLENVYSTFDFATNSVGFSALA